MIRSLTTIRNELKEDLGRLTDENLHILEDLVHTEKPWITKDSCCPDFTSYLQRLSNEIELDDARTLVWNVVESKGLHSSEPNPTAVLREAQSEATTSKKLLQSRERLLMYFIESLEDAFNRGEKHAIASAKKDADEALRGKDAAEMDYTVKENALNNLIADVASKKEAILSTFREASLEPASLTHRLPFGMLGRDECVAAIKEYTLNPADKYPPIMIISTSRAGKSLMLDTLKERFNKDVDDSGVFVVTCSLNGCRPTATKFEGTQCATSDAPQFVTFVYNLLLFGSIEQFGKPVNANWDSLVELDPNELCSLIREKHNLKPTTKLLFAVDELTTIFDKFDKDGQAHIVTRLGHLCNKDSQLLVTGFTVNAEKAFLGVSARKPVPVELKAIDAENRFELIPLMTAMLWGIRGQMGREANTHSLTYFYSIAHDVLKSSPGLMGTIVERLVVNTDGKLENITCMMPLWDVVGGLRDLLPDKRHFQNPENLSSGLDNLNGYLTSSDAKACKECYEELMRLNMAAPGRLDVFRILMAFIEWKRSSNTTAYPAVPAVDVLYAFVDHFSTLYLKWGEAPAKAPAKATDFNSVKGEFLEVAIRYGLRLLWLQMQSGRCASDTPLGVWADSELLGDLNVKSFSCKFPLNQKKNPVDLSKEVIEMFEPNTLFYPAGKAEGKPETNPLVDLVLNMPTKAGIVQVWVQVCHTLNKTPLSVGTLHNAMSVVNKYNGQVSPLHPEQQVLRVLYLLVGPNESEAKLVHDDGSEEVISNKRRLPPLHGGKEGSEASLTLYCVTSPKDRESLLGEFISQLVPDFESRGSLLEASLEEKVKTMSALNRIPFQGECKSLGEKRRALAASEDLLFDSIFEGSRFAAMKAKFPDSNVK